MLCGSIVHVINGDREVSRVGKVRNDDEFQRAVVIGVGRPPCVQVLDAVEEGGVCRVQVARYGSPVRRRKRDRDAPEDRVG